MFPTGRVTGEAVPTWQDTPGGTAVGHLQVRLHRRFPRGFDLLGQGFKVAGVGDERQPSGELRDPELIVPESRLQRSIHLPVRDLGSYQREKNERR